MPSKLIKTTPDAEVVEKTAATAVKTEPEKVSAPVASQEFLRTQLAETPTAETSGSTFLGSVAAAAKDDLSSSRGDTFAVGDKTLTANLGATKSVSGMDLGSGRGDTFTVAGKEVTANLGSTTKSVSGMDLGSGRGDTFTVSGKAVTANLGTTTKSVSGMDLGSGRGEEELQTVASELPAPVAADIAPTVSTQLGTTQDEAVLDAIANTPADKNVAVSLPAMTTMSALMEADKPIPASLQAEAEKEAEYKATTIKVEDIPAGLLEALPEKTILRLAFSPEDMGALDLQAEHEAVAKVADVFTLNNPTEETIKHVLSTGQFEDVIWSGHGATDGLWITAEDGTAKKLPAAEVAKLFEDSGVQEVLLNVCNGGVEVDNALGLAGINTFSYKRDIIDREAVEDATAFAQTGSLWGIEQTWSKDSGRVLTAEKASMIADMEARQAQWAPLIEQWKQGTDNRSQKDDKKSTSSLFKGLVSALGGNNGKSASAPGQVKKAPAPAAAASTSTAGSSTSFLEDLLGGAATGAKSMFDKLSKALSAGRTSSSGGARGGTITKRGRR
ncbi:MAG: hypothetical protein R3F61_34740 [Myxococcota bacterium]